MHKEKFYKSLRANDVQRFKTYLIEAQKESSVISAVKFPEFYYEIDSKANTAWAYFFTDDVRLAFEIGNCLALFPDSNP